MNSPKVPAADHTLRILRVLSSSRGPMAASMIAKKLELPRSTVYHLLATLQEHGFVMHLADEQRFGLGIAAFELSSAYARQEPLARIGRPLLTSLVDRMGVSGHLAVPHGRDVLYVVEERAQGAPALITGVNVRLPMPRTASGRAILAALPKAQVRALFPNREAFTSDDPDGIDRYSKLRSVLDATQTRGYAVERGSVTEGFSSVAVAVLDHREWPVAAIALTFREDDVTEEGAEELAREVAETARALAVPIFGRR